MIGSARTRATWLAVVVAASPLTGCESAVKHPTLTAGIVGGTLAFGTCKLASDNYGACAAVGGGAGAFLALVAATAVWLGGDGNSIAAEDQAQPVPLEDTRPRRHRAPEPPATSDPDQPPVSPPSATPPSPTPPSPTPPPNQPPANQPPATPSPLQSPSPGR
jgi:hypothetical protein